LDELQSLQLITINYNWIRIQYMRRFENLYLLKGYTAMKLLKEFQTRFGTAKSSDLLKIKDTGFSWLSVYGA